MATRQELHLEILNLEYGRFVKDQVLTEKQLNELIDFFEDQHRLTRTCLIGTGIVCGLQLSRTAASVTLAPGVAVTTDGDLLKTAEKTCLYFCPYTPPDDCHYDPFYFTDGGGEKMLTLHQLLTKEEKDALNSDNFKEIKDLDAVISDWVALLYLEYYSKDPAKCTPTDCDNLGIRQKATPKLLILSKADMDKLIHKDADEPIGDEIYLKYHEAYDQYFDFPVIRAKRVLPGGANTISSASLAGAYFTAAKNGAATLTSAIKQLYQAFGFVIDPGSETDINALAAKLTGLLANPNNTFHAQYTYDFYKDVIAAYNELRESLYSIVSECCPDIYSFPKHVMLGAPDIALGPRPPEYRHRFYPSPVTGASRAVAETAGSMFRRLTLLVNSFKVQLEEEARITPSLGYDRPLAERAIPFYYQEISNLAQSWSHERSQKGRVKHNLSYHADQYPAPVPLETLHPLDYDIDAYDFFRIEGHIGRPFQTVMQELNELRSVKGLPIDLVAVRLGDVKLSDIDLEDYACQFEDLDTILRAFQAEINCLLAQGTRFFSGFTAIPAEPHINLKLFTADPDQPKWFISDELLQQATLVKEASADMTVDMAGVKRTIAGRAERIVAGETAGSAKIAAKETISDVLTGMKKPTLAADVCDIFAAPVFSAERIVKTNLDLHQDAFGKYYLQALEAEPDSVDNFLEKARNLATAANALTELSEDERYVVFEYPLQIVGNLNYLQRFIPTGIGGISAELISGFQDFSKLFCLRLQAMYTRLERYFKSAGYNSRGFETVYLNRLNNLGELCCAYEKLEVILAEIEKRKTAILERLSFARFAEQHPGLEHKAGSHRGGTFVLVYAGAAAHGAPESPGGLTLTDTVRKAAGLKADSMSFSGSPYRDPDVFALYITGGDDTLDKEGELSRFLAYNNIRAGSVAAESLIRELNTRIATIRRIFCRELTEPEQDLVVADFCLPYLCCSDCPPLAFIIPREPKLLALPTDLACASDAPIPFSAYSPNGAVIGSPEAPAAIIAGDSPAFDPSKVADGQIGKTITFSLDGEPVDCVIVVRKPLALLLDADISDSGGDAFTVHYSNATDESQTGANSYAWSFNDGSSEVTTSTVPLAKNFSRTALAGKGITTIVVTVTVLADPCNSSGSLEVEVPAQPADPCVALVLDFIKTSAMQLTSDEFLKQLDKVGSPEVHDLHKATVTLLKRAGTAMANDDQAAREAIVIELHNLLQKVYRFPMSGSNMTPESRRVLEELLRRELLLMLNLVRCEPAISGASLENIIAGLSRFVEMKNLLIEAYPQLDAGDALQKPLTEYEATFVSQTDSLKSRLRLVIRTLMSFPR